MRQNQLNHSKTYHNDIKEALECFGLMTGESIRDKLALRGIMLTQDEIFWDLVHLLETGHIKQAFGFDTFAYKL